jgi:PAS domain S-box-containing protein
MPQAPSDTLTTAGRQDGAGISADDLNARLLDFARASADWFWETDADDRFTFISDQLSASTSLKPEDCIGKSRRELHDKVSQQEVWDRYDRIIAAQQPFRDFTFVVAGADGTTYPIAISAVPVFKDGTFIGYRGTGRRVPQGEIVEKLVRNIVDATSQAVGRDFLQLIASALCRELDMDVVLIGGLTEGSHAIQTLVGAVDGEPVENFEYDLKGSPCEDVIMENRMCVHTQGVAGLYPEDAELAEMGIEGYIGIPLTGGDGRCRGLIVVMRRSALVLDDSCKSVLEFFAGRVAAEIDRAKAEETLKSKEALLTAIVDNIPHGMTVKTPDGRYVLVNKEFARRYGIDQSSVSGLLVQERFPDWHSKWNDSRKQESEVVNGGDVVNREERRAFADGSFHDLEIAKFPIKGADGELVAIGTLATDITERKRQEDEVKDRERLLKKYHAALDRIVASDALASGNAQEAFELLTRVTAETLGVARVSVWRAAPDMARIDCLDLYVRTAATHERGAVLTREDFPDYFKALQQFEVIDAHDAARDPRTREFASGYLAEHGVVSMLDAAVHIGDDFKGVLCLEHAGEPREWSLEEQSLARSLAALTSLIMVREEQQAAEQARDRLEHRFSGVVNALPSSLSLKDRDLRYVFVNKIYERNYGVTAEEAYGKTIGQLGLNNPDILDAIFAEDTAVLHEGRSFTSETTRIGRDGVERSALVSKFPVYDGEGNVELIGTLWTDISEQKAVQNTLEEARARLRAITDNVPMMLCLKGLDGRYLEGNTGFAQWHGIDVQQVPGKRSSDLVNPGRAQVIDELDQRVIETGEVVVEESVSELQRRPDGKSTIFRMIKFPVRDAAGQVMAVGTAMTDITEQKLAQRALEETQARLVAITDNVPIMLSLKDLDGVYRHCNPSFAEWHGVSVDEVLGKTSADFLPKDRTAMIEDVDREVRETGEMRVIETDSAIGHLKGNKPVTLRQFKFPIRDASGAVTGIGTAMLDITDERRAEIALQAHLEKLEDMVADRTVELTQEIAERQRVEDDLRRSEANMRSILEKSPVGVAVVARSPRRRLFINQSFLDIFGAKNEEEINAVPMVDTYADAAELQKMSNLFDRDGAIDAVEVRRKRLDGEPIWLLMHARLVDFEGERAALVWHYDITKRKMAEEALARQAEVLEQTVAERTRELQESEQLLTSVFENLPAGIIIRDTENRLVRANSAYTKWYGVKPEEHIGTNALMAGPAQTTGDLALRDDHHDKVLSKGETPTREIERKFLDGRVHTVNVTKFPIYDEHGAVVRIGSVAVDVTQEVEARKALERHERLLRSLIDNLPVALIMTGPDNNYNLVNQTFCTWYDLDPSDILGTGIPDLAEKMSINDSLTKAQEDHVRARGARVTREVERRLADGLIHNIQINKYPFRDELGNVTGVVSVSVDLTDLRERERELSTLVENVPGLVFRSVRGDDGNIRIDFMSEGVEAIIGQSAVEVIQRMNAGDLAMFHPDDMTEYAVASQRCFDEGRPFEHTYRMVAADGAVRWVEERSRAIQQTKEGWVVEGLILDVTEQKIADDNLRESQAWLRAFTDNLPIYLNLKDADGRYVFANRQFVGGDQNMLEHCLGKTSEEAFPWATPELGALEREVMRTGEVRDFEGPAIRPELAGRIMRFIKFPVRDIEDKVIGVGSAAIDITDQRRAEEAIRENEAKLQAFTQNAPLFMSFKDLQGRIQFVNESYANWLRKKPEEIVGLTVREIFPGRDTSMIMEREAAVLETGEPVEFETGAMAAQGDGERVLQYIKFPVRNDQGEIFGIGTAMMDVTDRKRADLALKESESRFRGLFENAPAGITIKTTGGRYLAMNKTFLDWKGWDLVDVVGRTASDLFGEEAGRARDEEDAEVVARRGPMIQELVIDCADGRKLVTTNIKAPMLTPEGQVTGVCSFFVDVSEIREIEVQLQQAQKMEAVGRLAGGIAHDFNNLLGAMMGFNEFLIEDLPEGTPQHNFAQRVAKAGERAKQLVSQILAFSRASHGEQTVVDLNAIGEEAATLLSGTLPVTTRVVFHPSDAEVTALTNAGQMSQVMMNLGVNANDAFSGADGVINIGVERIPAGSKVLRMHEGPVKTSPEDFMEIRETEGGAWQVVAGAIDVEKDHVLVYVEDTGPGIPEPVLRRIFDPFFTTKEAGKGTGLGLAVVHGIVTAHHGVVRVHTRQGEGTRFEVLLPCAQPDRGRDAADEVAERIEGRGMILVVDDERDVADMVSIGLERLGYEVGVCAGGEEALEVFGEAPELWHAVISDQIMPDMRGMELIGKLKEIRADVPCVLCTGYSDTLTEESALAGGADAFFQKPVSAARLGRVLSDLLAR